MADYLAIDVGGTKIAVGIGNEKGQFLARDVMSTDPGLSSDAVLDAIAEMAKTLQDRIKRPFKTIGLGSPGPLDGPVLLDTANLSGWKGLNWKTGLEARLESPVSVQNDATAAGLGEWLYGSARGTQNCLYVTVSTGIGAGIIVNGALYAGSKGNAGEFGHLVMEPDGPHCRAGHQGCLESLASGTAIARAGRSRKLESAALRKLNEVQTRDVFLAYEKGDRVATEIIEEAADWLGRGLSYLINLFNPEKIILGGGVATHAPAPYRERVWNAAWHFALPALAGVTQLIPAELGEDSGLLGALAVAVIDPTPEGGGLEKPDYDQP